ncbi:hypothetical protein J2Z45_001780 [Cohnella lubricantis]|nr:hypothetical protein [Cohnella lubricantis]
MHLVYADKNNNVFDHPDLLAVARSGNDLVELLEEDLIPLPPGAALVGLPYTRAVGMDPDSGRMVPLPGDYYAVGALLPQGYTRFYVPGYTKTDKTQMLPLFGYTAVVWKDDGFYVAACQSDDAERWNPDNCDRGEVKRGVDRLVEKYPENRLYQHLSNCALGYECLTSSNTFLQRWEGGVPARSPATRAASAASPSSRTTAASSPRRRGCSSSQRRTKWLRLCWSTSASPIRSSASARAARASLQPKPRRSSKRSSACASRRRWATSISTRTRA